MEVNSVGDNGWKTKTSFRSGETNHTSTAFNDVRLPLRSNLSLLYDIVISFLLAAKVNTVPSAPSCARAVICSRAALRDQSTLLQKNWNCTEDVSRTTKLKINKQSSIKGLFAFQPFFGGQSLTWVQSKRPEGDEWYLMPPRSPLRACFCWPWVAREVSSRKVSLSFSRSNSHTANKNLKTPKAT